MRKVLFAILAVLLLIVVGLVIYKGFSIGNFEVWGIKQIVAKDEELEDEKEELQELVDIQFPGAISKLNNSGELMEATKKSMKNKQFLYLIVNTICKQKSIK